MENTSIPTEGIAEGRMAGADEVPNISLIRWPGEKKEKQQLKKEESKKNILFMERPSRPRL
jgi:hypothetical protein